MNQIRCPKRLFFYKADAWKHLNPTRNFDEFKTSTENFKNDASWIEASELFDLEFRIWTAQIEVFYRLHPTYFDELSLKRRLLKNLQRKKQMMKKMQPIFEMLLNAKRQENGGLRKMPIELLRMVHMFLI
jgi:glucose-6-phosphate-specific signal transduction histidine kinase